MRVLDRDEPSAPHDERAADGTGRRLPVRAIACGVAALMVTFLIVHRSTALEPAASVLPADAPDAERPRSALPTETRNEGNEGNEFVAGYVAVGDDDRGHAMFEGAGLLGPGDAVASCITVDYVGSLPAGVGLAAEVSGPLAGNLDMTVEVGRGGGFGDCAGFVRQTEIFRGTLASLALQHPPADPLPVFDTKGPEFVTMRVDVRLDDDGTPGDSTTAEFDWIAQPV